MPWFQSVPGTWAWFDFPWFDQTSSNPAGYMSIVTCSTSTVTVSAYPLSAGNSSVFTSPSALYWNQRHLQEFHEARLSQDMDLARQAQEVRLSAPAIIRRRSPPPPPELAALIDERAARRKAADDRALELLLSHLTSEQRVEFDQHRAFMVIGPSGVRYRVRCDRGVSGNVDRLMDGGDRVVHRLCAHMNLEIPQADQFLAQKLMLETDEAAFLKIANRHAVYS